MENKYVVKWEYKMSDEDLQKWFDEMINKGFALVAVNSDNQYIFERLN